MEIEKIQIERGTHRDGFYGYYRVRLAVNGFPCAYDPTCFEFWELEQSKDFWKRLALKCLEATFGEANYWARMPGFPEMRVQANRAIQLIGQLRQDLLSAGPELRAAA